MAASRPMARGVAMAAAVMGVCAVSMAVALLMTARPVVLDSYPPAPHYVRKNTDGAGGGGGAGGNGGNEYGWKPDDWRLNIQYGLHPDEANIPASENEKAMENLYHAGLEEGVDVYTIPAEKAHQEALRMKQRTAEIVRQNQDASLGGTPGGGVYTHDKHGAWKRHGSIKDAMCEGDPSDPYCDEEVIGAAYPHFSRAKFGPGVAYGHHKEHHAVGNFDYAMAHLTQGRHDPHYQEHLRRVERMHDRIARVDPVQQLSTESYGSVPTSFVAEFGPGVEPLNLQRAWDNQGFMGKYRIPPPEHLDGGHRLVRRAVMHGPPRRFGGHPREGTLPSY